MKCQKSPFSIPYQILLKEAIFFFFFFFSKSSKTQIASLLALHSLLQILTLWSNLILYNLHKENHDPTRQKSTISHVFSLRYQGMIFKKYSCYLSTVPEVYIITQLSNDLISHINNIQKQTIQISNIQYLSHNISTLYLTFVFHKKKRNLSLICISIIHNLLLGVRNCM